MRLPITIALLSLAASIATPAASAQDAPGGAYAVATTLYRSGHITADECTRGAMEALVEARWKLRKPAAGARRFVAELDSPATTLVVDCAENVLVGATYNHSDGGTRDRQLETAKAAISSRLAGSWDFAAKRYVWRRPLSSVTPTWHAAPPLQSVVVVRAPYTNAETRCIDAARIGLEGTGFKASGNAFDAPSGTKATIQCEARRGGPSMALLVARSAPDRIQATTADLARIGEAIRAAEALAPAAPYAAVGVTLLGTSSENCVARAEAGLAGDAFTVRRFPGGVTGRKEDHERTFFCMADGAVGVADSQGLDLGSARTSMWSPTWKPDDSRPDARRSSVAGRAGGLLIPHDLQGGDCRSVAEPALAAAGYLPSGVRVRHAGKAAYECITGAVQFVVFAEPAGGVTPTAELAAIAASWAAELDRPHWSGWNIEPIATQRLRSAYMDFPYQPRSSEVSTATGTRHVSVVRYRGVTFSAWVQPAMSGLSDDAQLDRVVDQVTAEGLSVQTTRKASYASYPAVAVWGSRTVAGDGELRSISRYTVRQGQVYATEVLFREGTDVADDLTRFADSLRL
jgi:hypothetical protein